MDGAASLFDETHLKQLIRTLVEERGAPVRFTGTDWQGNPEPSYYGWEDHEAQRHVHPYEEPGCAWVIADQAVLIEKTYGVFDGTDHSGLDEVGINISPVRCACGKYDDMTLRYAASLGEVLKYVLDNDGRGISI